MVHHFYIEGDIPMTLSIFEDKTAPPGERELLEALGETKQLWDRLKIHVKENQSGVIEDWKHYGKNSGWTLKLLKKKRNLFFLYPGKGFFTVVYIIGDKAVQAIENSSLPQYVIDMIKESPKYAEGRGLRIPVTNPDELEIVKTLLQIKLDN
jgi:hypothetical protein